MADVVPFMCWQPRQDLVAAVTAAPYDTLSRTEAAQEIATHPLSFLRIDKPAALYDADVDEYDPCVYARARLELDEYFSQGVFISGNPGQNPTFALYRLTQGSHTQTGVVACASVADYQSGVIRRHENTRAHKEQDRVDHIRALEAHTSPVLLTYPSVPQLDALLERETATTQPHFDFVACDGVRHEFWQIQDATVIELIRTEFAALPTLYIADGHHRAAAAARVASLPEHADNSEAQYFLVALFGSNELQVLDYNRVISDLAGHTPAKLLNLLEEMAEVRLMGLSPYRPLQRGEMGMYLDGAWYCLRLDEALRPEDAVESLDVALLHSLILDPLFGITEPRSDPRITYVGGARGLEELAQRADKAGGAAFALYPCSLPELFAVADADRLMPPKSTWFEPKPRSGLALHRL